MTDDELNPDEVTLPIAQASAAASYHAPPDTLPREAMWAAIQARRALNDGGASLPCSTVAEVLAPAVTVTHTTRGARPRVPRWIAAVAAASVVIVASVVVGRERGDVIVTKPAVIDSAQGAVAWQVASTEHFGIAESMLTTLSATSQASGDRQLTAWSRDLLESTRLLMDSPAGRDPKRRALLLDLELVLVQLVESGPAVRIEDRSVMDELLSQSALLLTRIRTTIPAGVPASND